MDSAKTEKSEDGTVRQRINLNKINLILDAVCRTYIYYI